MFKVSEDTFCCNWKRDYRTLFVCQWSMRIHVRNRIWVSSLLLKARRRKPKRATWNRFSLCNIRCWHVFVVLVAWVVRDAKWNYSLADGLCEGPGWPWFQVCLVGALVIRDIRRWFDWGETFALTNGVHLVWVALDDGRLVGILEIVEEQRLLRCISLLALLNWYQVFLACNCIQCWSLGCHGLTIPKSSGFSWWLNLH